MKLCVLPSSSCSLSMCKKTLVSVSTLISEPTHCQSRSLWLMTSHRWSCHAEIVVFPSQRSRPAFSSSLLLPLSPLPFPLFFFSLFLLSFFSVVLVIMLKRCSERRHPCLLIFMGKLPVFPLFKYNGHRHSYGCFLSSPEIPFVPNLHFFFLFKVE